MSIRTVLVFSCLAICAPAIPAAAADQLSIQTLGARVAARPTGEEAKALAEEIRTWFGKDRSGKYNVMNGADPKIQEREAAWAIEAPLAQAVAIATSDGKTLPLSRIGETPIFAATYRFPEGSALRWSYVIDGRSMSQRGSLRSM
jgi:hypothetical protein